ncbi:DUF3145 family protein [Jatrophihabitans sp.]|uniref:DUF3145 family protein n=1 Tax=Jatrophihabitans sp. TaxID=1932789 RepID=UPI0030C73C05|nr:hypothetical protein [Jatrophihabitans sp.]
MTTTRASSHTRGVVFMHCCPSAVAPHVEWALAGEIGRPVRLEWTAQPVTPMHLRAEASWSGPIGTAARLAGALRAWPMLVFEVTEDGTSSSDGERLAYVPGRGFHRSTVSANGDVMVGEERLRGLLARARTADDYAHGLAELLGTAWDAELEPYRLGGDGAPVSLLHQVV